MSRLYKKQAVTRHPVGKSAVLLKQPITAPSTARTFGYARVSTEEQVLDVQMTALQNAGCDRVFAEKISALNAKRPQFHLMMKHLERGDTLVVYSFSRLSRDLLQLLTIVKEMKALGVTLRSTSEPHIDPYTTSGRLLLSVTGAVDENERGRVRDRTKDAMAEKKRRGMYLGRPRVVDDKKIAAMQKDRRRMTAAQVAAKHGVSAATVNNYAPKHSAR